jgi:hypothetical protein
MGDNTNNYSDNSFNLYQAYSYSLLLQVEPNSFGYAFVSHNRLLVSAQNCEFDELANPKKLSEVLTATYRKVIVGLPATGLTLVPKTPAYVAAAVEKFGLQNTVYAAKGWLKAILKSRPYSDTIYLDLGTTHLQIAYFSGNILRFYNIFEFRSEEDLVYCTTLVTDELRLKPQATTLVLSGNIIPNDKNMKRLADFFPRIELNNIKVIDLPGQLPPYKVLSLAALSLCE